VPIGDDNYITATLDQDVTSYGDIADGFTAVVGGSSVAITAGEQIGKNLIGLTLASNVTTGQVVTLTYTRVAGR